MLILQRKIGEGVEVINQAGESHEVDLMRFNSKKKTLRVDGVEKQSDLSSPFYLDEGREVMVIVVRVEQSSIRFGFDAPRSWKIRRKEVDFN